jgi:hypothetical protein
MTEKTYPAWQKELREEQRKRAEEKAAEDLRVKAQVDEEEKRLNAERAAALKEVLALAGIDCEPTSARVSLEGYDILLYQYQRTEKTSTPGGEKKPYLQFKLWLVPLREGKPVETGAGEQGEMVEGATYLDPAPNKAKWMARFANAIDAADAIVDRELANRKSWEEMTKIPLIPDPPSPEERIAVALERIADALGDPDTSMFGSVVLSLGEAVERLSWLKSISALGNRP